MIMMIILRLWHSHFWLTLYYYELSKIWILLWSCFATFVYDVFFLLSNINIYHSFVSYFFQISLIHLAANVNSKDFKLVELRKLCPTAGQTGFWKCMNRTLSGKYFNTIFLRICIIDSSLCFIQPFHAVPNGRDDNVVTWPWHQNAKTLVPHRRAVKIWVVAVVKAMNKVCIHVLNVRKLVKNAAAVLVHRNVC